MTEGSLLVDTSSWFEWRWRCLLVAGPVRSAALAKISAPHVSQLFYTAGSLPRRQKERVEQVQLVRRHEISVVKHERKLKGFCNSDGGAPRV